MPRKYKRKNQICARGGAGRRVGFGQCYYNAQLSEVINMIQYIETSPTTDGFNKLTDPVGWGRSDGGK